MSPSLPQQLHQHVIRLASEIGPRFLERPSSITATIDHITDHWHSLDYHVEQERYDAFGRTATNLIATIPGSSRPDEIVLLGAHYDTVPSTPGADDNASAVAVLLEVSRLLRQHTPQRTIRFVAFACEEPPYFHSDAMGSRHHARQSRLRGDDIKAMLCLEMVGYFSDQPGSQDIPPQIPAQLKSMISDKGNFLAAAGNPASADLVHSFAHGFRAGSSLPLLAVPLPESIPLIRLSDNSSFWDEGYPALMLTDTSFLRNPHYHAPTDTPDTLNYNLMAQVTTGVTSAVRHLAE